MRHPRRSSSLRSIIYRAVSVRKDTNLAHTHTKKKVLNDIKSEYGKNINAIKYEKDNYNISSTEERLTIIIIDEINVNLSEMLNAIPNTSELFLIMSPCEITLQDMLMECWSPISLKLLMELGLFLI